MSSQRNILDLLTEGELQHLVEQHQLAVTDRRVRDDLVKAAVGLSETKFAAVLAGYSRSRLGQLCREMGLDDDGVSEKAGLVARILGTGGERAENAELVHRRLEALGRGLHSAKHPASKHPARTMDKDARNAIDRATQRARKVLEADFAEQLEGTFDVLLSGTLPATGGKHLSVKQRLLREKIVCALEHKHAAGMSAAEAVADYLRDAAFTALNRFAALKMLEARELVLECISKGEQSAGYKEFCGLAPGIALLPDGAGYRLYLESIFDELSTEVKVLFDRRDMASVLWPRRAALTELLAILCADDLAAVWREDETIGWVYQYFNSGDERRQMRDESQAPRNSRELAVRNQFFTPRYVVQFLTDNTLGRTWVQMQNGETSLVDRCAYLVRDKEGVLPRARKDPRDLRILDPACGSGHFLLYAFDLLLVIYEEAWHDPHAPRSAAGTSLREDYHDVVALRRAAPALILEHNLHGVDIDPRAAQIAALALWLRAQRAFKELGLIPSQRPTIARTHIVVAEPMPGDEAMVEAFAADLRPPLLKNLFRKMVGEMRLAGELGTLLRVEDGIADELRRAREQFIEERQTMGFLPGLPPVRQQTALDLSGIDDAKFFHEAEGLLVEALRHFAGLAADAAGVRRRLFADDATQGLALIDIAQTRFDVVLMNPPFGAPSRASEGYFEEHYATTGSDLASAFLEAMRARLVAGGLLGIISTRKPLFLKSFAQWRKQSLLDGAGILTCADLGRGVLDATVEAAAYVVSSQPQSSARFFRCFEGGMVMDSADVLLRDAIAGAGGPVDAFECQSGTFAAVPNAPIAYWASPELLRTYLDEPSFAECPFTAQTGASTKDDFRFLRLWVEVAAGRVARQREVTFQGKPWVAIAKGGEYAPFFRGVELVMNWGDDGREAKAFVSAYRAAHGWSPGWAAELSGADLYFRPGITWSRRTSTWISPRILPAGCMFSEKAPTIFHEQDDGSALLGVLGWMSSSSVSALIALSVGKEGTMGTSASNSYEVGIISTLPCPEDLSGARTLAGESYWIRRASSSADELCHFFAGPTMARGSSSAASARALQVELDSRVGTALGVTKATLASLAEDSRLAALEGDLPFEERLASTEPNDLDVLSFLVGITFGRYKAEPQQDAGHSRNEDPFAPLPVCSPAMNLIGHGAAVPILVDDKGHKADLVAAVRRVVVDSRPELEAFLDSAEESLRPLLRERFFAHHISRYSRSRRKAPIYWQLATPKASYSVWLHLHAFTKDTLYQLQNDYVAPKLRHEEGRLESVRKDVGVSPTASQRKELAAQEGFVEELRAFLDEVKRVTPLWDPDLDDGVVINFAPLWRLVPQHKTWQKECKATWDALCAGEYDWAHLAMHLWPERVVPKCATDRSLAIAHGLEDVFWLEDENGKWKPRLAPTKNIDALVKKRSSSAVKAALKSLVEAPMSIGNTARRTARKTKAKTEAAPDRKNA